MGKASPDKMGTAPMFRLIMSMALPAMFSMLIQALYNVVDSIFVSKINENALAAVSLAFPIQMLIIAVAVGTGVGINSLVSRKLGEGDIKQADSAATHGLLLGVASWLVFAIMGLTIVRPFFSFYTDSREIFDMGVSYLSCVMIFSFGCFVEINLEKTLQATGNMIQPMIFMLIGAVTNIVLDPMFIFGIGFFPKLGVLGAAVATVIGQIVSMIYAIFIMFCKKHAVKISFKGFKPSLSIVKKIYTVGVPSIVMQSIGSVLLLFLNQILVGFSTAAVSVLGVYYKLQSFVFMPVFGLNQGSMPIMGYNYGARNKKRLLLALKYSCLIALVIMTVGTAVFWLFPELLLSMFSPTREMIEIGVPSLRTISLCFIPATIGIVFTTLFQAVGKGLRSLFLSVLRQLVVIVPVAYLFSFIDLWAVWYAFPIAELVSVAAALLMYRNLLHGDFKKLDTHA